MKKMRRSYARTPVVVTKRDITLGQRRTASACPVAFAVSRATGMHFVAVARYYLRINGMNYKLPLAAQRFINDFDLGASRRTKPFTFRIGRKLPEQ